MRFPTLISYIFFAWVVAAQEPDPRWMIPGVGFSLTPDYGTAAIYYANGTWTEVARVEGSNTYKAMMRKEPSTELVPHRFSWSSMTDVVCPLLDMLRPELCERHPDVESAKELLGELKAAVAARLKTTFCYAQITLPARDWTYQADVADQALHSLRLRPNVRALGEDFVAYLGHQVASGRYGSLEGTYSNLVVGYSASGLSASLLEDDDGVIEIIRENRDTSLGARNRAQPDHQKQMKALIEKITERPFGNDSIGWLMPDDLEEIVLHGDATSNAEFLEVLRSIFGAKPYAAHGLDPVFSAALGAADIGFRHMDDWEFVARPAMGCAWLSDLYTDNGEL